jgi:hypothetical protein
MTIFDKNKQAIEELYQQGLPSSQIADRLRINPNTMRRLMSERGLCNRRRGTTNATASNASNMLQLPVVPHRTPLAWHERDVPLPEAIPDDTGAVIEEVKRIFTVHPLVTVFVASDMHFPDHDIRAIALMIELERWVKPYIVVYNGDIFDFGRKIAAR